MPKINSSLTSNITSMVIGSLLTIIIVGVFGWFSEFVQLPSKVEKQSSQIQTLDKTVKDLRDKYLIIATALETNFHVNISELIKLSQQKKVPTQDVQTALKLIGSSPEKARGYLQEQLKFTPNEIKAVFNKSH